MPAGLSIYFVVSNVVGMGITWATNRWLSGDDTVKDTPTRRPSPISVSTLPEDKSASTRKKPTHKKRGYKRRK